MSEKFVLALDSSQLTASWECLQKWVYLYKECITPKPPENTVSVPSQSLLMGTYGHKLLEAFDYALITGMSKNQALDFTYSGEFLEPKYELVNTKYLEQVVNLEDKTKRLVEKQINTYLLTNWNNYYIPEAVELGFSEILYEDENNLFLLEGRFDVLAKVGPTPVIIDHKFQERAKPLYTGRPQFRNYSMIAKRPMMINYIRLTEGINKNTFQRIMIEFTRDQHIDWRHRVIMQYFKIKQILYGLHGVEDARTPTACEGFWSYCSFIKLCEETNPKLVQIAKERDFVVKDKWLPF